ncbi:putative sugar nucleotidyltransferase and phosphatidyltransferase [Nitrospira sp. KM1]|uniref:CDP-alcohol phosphatidyltransferase family protein n=1 Tax=Nitrospira sp. KM1 TaxID=1936990 RepID=UPI0013A77F94|nr:CDP-alcohol phosphatidyltransferase family protein [Nitrospira sp. KM1]BCA55813.1 putative sugar nucleotidyltransferase and phosphatidyltransferase [Nitrospira sp. KM1]
MSDRLVHTETDVQGLSTAILLPSMDLFGSPIRSAVPPLTQVVGIGLFQRTVLTLQRAGIRQLIVLSGSDEDQLKVALTKGPRVTIPVRWMPLREFPVDDPRTWEALGAEVRGFCLLSGVGGVFSRPLIEQLRQDVQEGEAIVVAHRSGASPDGKANMNVLLSNQEEELADVVVLPCELLDAASLVSIDAGMVPVRRWLQEASRNGRVRILTTDANAGRWYQEIRNPADLQTAERKLFLSLKSEFEGFIDRYFNRKLSRWFTRIFLMLGLSPNSITMVATIIGLLAAAEFASGSYGAGLLGAALFQLSAVIDCCDGEVARLTFTESPFGAWLDMAMDNVVHLAIFGGIAWGLYLSMAGATHDWVPLALGATAILGNVLSFVSVNRAQGIKASSGWRTARHAAWAEFMLKNVASRDFSVAVFLFALFGVLELFLWIAAAGSLAFAMSMLWIIRPSARSEPAQRG